MNNQQQISVGQLAAILLTSRLAVAMTFAPTVHQLSHGTDFLLSILLQALLLALLLLPTWWFARRSEGISTLDYAVAVMGKGGGVVAVFYGPRLPVHPGGGSHPVQPVRLEHPLPRHVPRGAVHCADGDGRHRGLLRHPGHRPLGGHHRGVCGGHHPAGRPGPPAPHGAYQFPAPAV